MVAKLSTTDHNRDSAGLKYIYPVLSRRAGGLSIGVNFNTNNACNWRCMYCQVPDLQRGSAPAMDLVLLEQELRFFLQDVQKGDFFERYQVPVAQRVIKDIAISGNGEPSSLKIFDQAIQSIGRLATEAGVFPASKFVLISNGSLMQLATVQSGLKLLAGFGGELWFKLDSATLAGRKRINSATISQQRVLANLQTATNLCPTKLQTCVFHYQDTVWSRDEKQAYLQWLADLKMANIKLAGILLYSIARESHQPEAGQMENMAREEMDSLAADIKALGYEVSVSY